MLVTNNDSKYDNYLRERATIVKMAKTNVSGEFTRFECYGCKNTHNPKILEYHWTGYTFCQTCIVGLAKPQISLYS